MPKEQQHYVPQIFLKNFLAGKKPFIWVYDKATDRIFQTNIRNVAAEKGFYDLEVDNAVLTVESELANLEAHTSNILKTLLREKTIHALGVCPRIRAAAL